jgi:diguanylate cyclase (GGDEF)-like protein
LEGRATHGVRVAAKAFELARRLGSSELEAQSLLLKGWHEFRLGRNEASLSTLTRAAQTFDQNGDDVGLSFAQSRMVPAYHNLGLTDEALRASERGVECAKRSGDLLALAAAYLSAGTAHNSAGDHEGALAATQLGLEIAREAGDARSIFIALNNSVDDLLGLTRLHRDAGDAAAESTLARALAAAEEALAMARDLSPYQTTLALMNLGDALGLSGRQAEAEAMLRDAMGLADENGFCSLAFSARELGAQLIFDAGQAGEAARLFEALLADATDEGESRLQLGLLRSLSRAHKQLGNFERALEYLERYCALDERLRCELADTRSRLLGNQVELDRMHRAAEQALRDADAERARARELEHEKALLERRTRRLERRADRDELTGLWNRRYIERMLPQAVRNAHAGGGPLSAVMVDADHFKAINDTFGHGIGDQVLRRMAMLLRTGVRPDDIAARLGGEEFILLLPDTPGERALDVGRRLWAAVRGADWDDLVPGSRPTISVGVATVDRGEYGGGDRDRSDTAVKATVADLLARADAALYRAKHAGRDCVVAASS